VLAQPGVRWVIFSDDPINDLGSTHPPPPADALIAVLKGLSLGPMRKTFSSSVLRSPRMGANYWTASGEAVREQVNAFLRSGKNGCDAVIDQDTATHDPVHPTRYPRCMTAGTISIPMMRGIVPLRTILTFLYSGSGQNER
jgi:hypothetical protein